MSAQLMSIKLIEINFTHFMYRQDDSTESDDDHECSTIPDEVLLDYAYRQQNIKALREQLRQDLRDRFAVMCGKTPSASSAAT